MKLYQFTQEIKDKERLLNLKAGLMRLIFKGYEIQEGFADMVLQIVHHKEGTSTHLVSY